MNALLKAVSRTFQVQRMVTILKKVRSAITTECDDERRRWLVGKISKIATSYPEPDTASGDLMDGCGVKQILFTSKVL